MLTAMADESAASGLMRIERFGPTAGLASFDTLGMAMGREGMLPVQPSKP